MWSESTEVQVLERWRSSAVVGPDSPTLPYLQGRANMSYRNWGYSLIAFSWADMKEVVTASLIGANKSEVSPVSRYKWIHSLYNNFWNPTKAIWGTDWYTLERERTPSAQVSTLSLTHSSALNGPHVTIDIYFEPVTALNPRCENFALAASTLWGLTKRIDLEG